MVLSPRFRRLGCSVHDSAGVECPACVLSVFPRAENRRDDPGFDAGIQATGSGGTVGFAQQAGDVGDGANHEAGGQSYRVRAGAEETQR